MPGKTSDEGSHPMTTLVEEMRAERDRKMGLVQGVLPSGREVTVAEYLHLAEKQGVSAEEALVILGELLQRRVVRQSVTAALISEA